MQVKYLAIFFWTLFISTSALSQDMEISEEKKYMYIQSALGNTNHVAFNLGYLRRVNDVLRLGFEINYGFRNSTSTIEHSVPIFEPDTSFSQLATADWDIKSRLYGISAHTLFSMYEDQNFDFGISFGGGIFYRNKSYTDLDLAATGYGNELFIKVPFGPYGFYELSNKFSVFCKVDFFQAFLGYQFSEFTFPDTGISTNGYSFFDMRLFNEVSLGFRFRL